MYGLKTKDKRNTFLGTKQHKLTCYKEGSSVNTHIDLGLNF